MPPKAAVPGAGSRENAAKQKRKLQDSDRKSSKRLSNKVTQKKKGKNTSKKSNLTETTCSSTKSESLKGNLKKRKEKFAEAVKRCIEMRKLDTSGKKALREKKDPKLPDPAPTPSQPVAATPPQDGTPTKPQPRAPFGPQPRAPSPPQPGAPIPPQPEAPTAPQAGTPPPPQAGAPALPQVGAPTQPEVGTPISPQTTPNPTAPTPAVAAPQEFSPAKGKDQPEVSPAIAIIATIDKTPNHMLSKPALVAADVVFKGVNTIENFTKEAKEVMQHLVVDLPQDGVRRLHIQTRTPGPSQKEKTAAAAAIRPTDVPKAIIRVEQFSEDVKKMMRQWLVDLSQGGIYRLRKEFVLLRTFQPLNPQAKSCDANGALCRYNDIACYDATRVVLSWPVGNTRDFIHANRVQHELLNNQFICTQAPLAETVDDFWRMIWQEQVGLIIMLCNITEKGKKKCHQYWPVNVNGTMQTDDISVKTLNIDESDSSIVVNTLEIQSGNEKRVVCHRQWISWPDRAVPKSPMAPFRLLQFARQEPRPVVVHCSAGVGRTGTLVLIEMMLSSLKRGTKPDTVQLLKDLRSQRARSVQTEDQYAYAHYAIVQMLLIKKVFTDRDVKGFCKEYETYIKLLSQSNPKKFMPLSVTPAPAPGTAITHCEADEVNEDKQLAKEHLKVESDKKKVGGESMIKILEKGHGDRCKIGEKEAEVNVNKDDYDVNKPAQKAPSEGVAAIQIELDKRALDGGTGTQTVEKEGSQTEGKQKAAAAKE